VLAGAAGVTIALWHSPRRVDLPAPPRPDATALPRPVPAPPVMARASGSREDVEAPPPGVNAEQWRALRDELADRPDELARVVNYLGFAQQLRQFEAMNGQDGAARRALATTLDRELDAHLRQRELNAAEARRIKSALLAELVSDEAGRSSAMARWQAAQRDAAPAPDALAVARDQSFATQQASLLSAWSSTPAAQRDPKVLEEQLNDLRRRSYGASH